RTIDNPFGAAMIGDELASRFGVANVFRDCISISAGTHYPTAIQAALEKAQVLVAVIGPQWLTLTDPLTGHRLIDRDHDCVRREPAWGFQHSLQVVPVLLKDTPDQATQPKPDDLPGDIRLLATIQALVFSQYTFRADLDRLVARLVDLVPTLVSKNGRSE